MQVNLITNTYKPTSFKAVKQNELVVKKEEEPGIVKPIGFLAASVIPIGIGIIGIKKGVTGLEKAYKDNKLPEFFNYLLPEEKPVVQQMIKDGLNPKLAEMFVKLKNAEDKEKFAKEAYDSLMNIDGFDSLKPEFKIKDNSERKSNGAWRPLDFYMEIYKLTTLSNPKYSILNTITHEIEHFKQDCLILRTEGYGADALVDAVRKKIYNSYQNDETTCINFFHKPFSDLTESDVEDRLDLRTDRKTLKLYESYYRAKYGIIPKNSEEGQKAKKYIEATENHVSIDHEASSSEKDKQEKLYENNLLEKEAFAAGDKIQELYQDFIIKLADVRQKAS